LSSDSRVIRPEFTLSKELMKLPSCRYQRSTTTMTTAKEERYTRKISSEEAKKGYIFVLRDKLSFFPSQGKTFDLATEKVEKKVSVESYSCTCRGPDLRHEHYFIRWEGLRFGDKVSIRRDDESAEKYHMVLHR
jgi:hypothetical protein